MNDRFKFRAWDECNNKMHYDFQFITSGDSANDWIIFQSDKQKLDFDKEKNFCINIYPNPYFAQQLKIMQCIGLKDKNGKLIYEGDILQQPQMPHKVVCEWYKGGFWLNGFMNGAKRELSNMHNWYEVIGNIYEDKDLLNA